MSENRPARRYRILGLYFYGWELALLGAGLAIALPTAAKLLYFFVLTVGDIMRLYRYGTP